MVTKTALVYILESVFDLNDLYGRNITSNSCVLLYGFQNKTRCLRDRRLVASYSIFIRYYNLSVCDLFGIFMWRQNNARIQFLE